jgi:hypothetical protein
MTRSDPDEATAGLELPAVWLVVLPALLLLLLLLQAAARAATATLSADARSRAVLRALFIAGSNPQWWPGRDGDWPVQRRARGALAWQEVTDDDWTVNGRDPHHQ